MPDIPLLVDDFTSFNIGGTSPGYDQFVLLQQGTFIADRGIVTSNYTGTYITSILTPPPTPDPRDYVVWLVYREKSFPHPSDAEIIVQSTFSVKDLAPPPCKSLIGITNLFNIPYGNNIIPLTSDMLVVGDIIYGIYEILPFNKPEFTHQNVTDYAAFTSAIPIGDKRDMDPRTGEFTGGMAYNKTGGYWRFLINGEERFRVTNIGQYPNPKYIVANYGGPPTNLVLDNVHVGYGMFAVSNAIVECSGLIKLTPGSLAPEPCFDTGGEGGILHLIQQLVYTSTYVYPVRPIFDLDNICVEKEEDIDEVRERHITSNILLQTINDAGRISSLPLSSLINDILSIMK